MADSHTFCLPVTYLTKQGINAIQQKICSERSSSTSTRGHTSHLEVLNQLAGVLAQLSVEDRLTTTLEQQQLVKCLQQGLSGGQCQAERHNEPQQARPLCRGT